MRSSFVACSLALVIGCGSGSAGAPDATATIDAAPAVDASNDIVEFLSGVPGLSFTEGASEYPGYRLFLIDYAQPLDHAQPNGRTFSQRLRLHHLDAAAPMILYTSGYWMFGDDYLSELGRLLGGNQISTEQRFFGASIPSGVSAADWAYVTIAQAAADHHRVVQALAPFYGAAWVSTGHSKGGMTSIYHRRFYPDDVDATVAYVAPISFGAPDPRYDGFFDAVASSTCRDALRAIQINALERFPAMLSRAQLEAQQAGMTFVRSGGQEAAFEGDLAGMRWSFWQYAGAGYCGEIPPTNASDDVVFDFVQAYAGIGIDDASIGAFEPYYYQALYQLGFPGPPESHLDNLRQYADVGGDYLPRGVAVTYDPAPMLDIAAWVDTAGSELMFVYGQYDPWFAGAFDPGGAADSHFYVVDGANHGALISMLPGTARADAFDVLERWTGVAPQPLWASGVRPPPVPRVRLPLAARSH
ncbi:MAG TPA: S28 family serine protease [Kofleriaceae bacterium]|nr:S28 family serine protease [Kofleriaceae bacterium]